MFKIFKKKELSVIEIADRFVQEIKEKEIVVELDPKTIKKAREVVANMKPNLRKKEMKELIRRSIVLWNEWKQKNQEEFRNVFTPEKGWHDIVVKGRKIDLSGVDFSGMDLDGKDTLLGAIDFRRVILRRAKFRKANLRNAAFENANLEEADFTEADIREAYFDSANLRRAKFMGTEYWQARFYKANTKGTRWNWWTQKDWDKLDPIAKGIIRLGEDVAYLKASGYSDIAREMLGQLEGAIGRYEKSIPKFWWLGSK